MGEWIERYRIFIGLGLIALILGSGSFLAYRLNLGKSQPTVADNSETRISQLESKVKELEAKSSQTTVVSNPVNTEAPASTAPTATATTGKVAGVSTGLININTASASELDALPGIGPVIAKSIVDYRTAHGNFHSIDDIQNVPRIGPATFSKFKDKITVN
jgi:competence protein ComEA